MRGRKPKPTALKLIDGNPGRTKISKNEPKCFASAKVPTWLSREAKVEWRRYAPELERMGLLTEIDVPVFAGLCSAIADFRWCEKHLAENGRLTTAKNGEPRTSPVVVQRRHALEHIRQFSAEFGLTPSSRTRITVSDDKLPSIGSVFGPAVTLDNQ